MSLSMLNDDIYRLVLSFLSISELNRVHETSKTFRMAQLATEDCLWKNYTLKTINALVQRAQYKLPSLDGFKTSTTIDDFYLPYMNHGHAIQKDFKLCLIHLQTQMNIKVENNMKNVMKQLTSLQKSSKSKESPFIDQSQLVNLKDQIINQYATQLLHSPLKFKAVFNGEGAVGKSSLIYTISYGTFPDYWMFRTDGAMLNKTLDNNIKMELSLWDTAGQVDYDKLRVLSYPETDVFLVCFDVANLESFWKVHERWIPEIRNFSQYNIPILLIGCKTDLRNDTSMLQRLREQHFRTPITPSMGESLAKACHCLSYAETSSLYNNGLDDLTTLMFRSVILKATHGFQQLFPQHSNRCMLQ
ncbi:hypothetical protein C9374_003796 [Naegleria lovaniensis]|uniref:F-box domain-containing protein n=1 Tax=Naegleria lovaniensis TaxID=51637 RepID=A0AA88H8F2_NAELO|nr:uncharacterized protein C9374_003796 [Naegleria lovaniensis]KAG2394032.1 hypothetical protein C9374_003796 [Naegleria lovaniensis]